MRRLTRWWASLARHRRPLAGGSALLVVLGWWGWRELHPPVRLLNRTPVPLVVTIDGKRTARLEPTLSETANAGLVLRVAAGERTFVATRDDGVMVDVLTASVHAGLSHLYAPGSREQGVCFAVDTDAYGAAGSGVIARDPLLGGPALWAFGETVDAWFEPNPSPSKDDRGASGGLRRALREHACR